MTTVEFVTQDSDRTETSDPKQAHIIRATGGESAAAKIMRARVEGTELEALCGHVFVPSSDASMLPMCKECQDIYELFRIFDGRYPEKPSD